MTKIKRKSPRKKKEPLHEKRKPLSSSERQAKTTKKRTSGGERLKKIYLHEETLEDLTTIASDHGFPKPEKLGYDDLSLLITLLVDWHVDNASFSVCNYETARLKRLHLTAKYCLKETEDLDVLEYEEIQKLFLDNKYSLSEETIENLLSRSPKSKDMKWSRDVVNALSDEDKVRFAIECMSH